MNKRRLLITIFCWICVAGAEAPESISKWCHRETGHVRYSNQDQARLGYEVCGGFTSVTYCDGLGGKYFGAPQAAPGNYIECGNIQIRKKEKPQNGAQITEDIQTLLPMLMKMEPGEVSKSVDLQSLLKLLPVLSEGTKNPSSVQSPGGLNLESLLEALPSAAQDKDKRSPRWKKGDRAVTQLPNLQELLSSPMVQEMLQQLADK